MATAAGGAAPFELALGGKELGDAAGDKAAVLGVPDHGVRLAAVGMRRGHKHGHH